MQSRFNNGLTAKLAAGVRVVTDLAKRGAALGRGPNRGDKLLAAPWSQTWPAPGATLDLDFSNDRGFVRGVGNGRSMDAVTFTRASNGNWVDSAGVLRTGAGTFPGTANALGVNLLSNSQDFASWSSTNASVTQNSLIAPDNTYTASKIIPTATSGFHFITSLAASIVSGSTYTSSVYAKAGEIFKFTITTAANLGEATFDLVAKTAVPVSGSSATITELSDGWFRCSVYKTSSGTGNDNLRVLLWNPSGATNNYTGDGTSGIFIWGAQLELGSSATTYYPTNINVPRFDWASTAVMAQVNLMTYTQEFDNSVWTKTRTTLTANTASTTDPLGGNTADALFETAVTNTFSLNNNIPRTGTHTSSMYVKANGRTFVAVVPFSGLFSLSNAAVFNLSTGTVVSTGSNVISASISDEGSGWWRCSAVALNPTGYGILPMLDATTASYAGDVTKGIFVWGAQVELGSSVTAYQAVGAQVPTNTPLLPATTCNGLLIEESRANRILWCRDATQSNWTKTNVTAAKTATGIDGVANAASSLTASAANGTCIQTITLASGSRTASVYLKRITGTGNVQVSLDGSTWSTVDLSSTEWRRIVLSGTVTNPVVGIRLATNGDAVAMDYAQVEDGGTVTTPILTTTASATRAVDSASMAQLAWLAQGKGTIAQKWRKSYTAAGVNYRVLYLVRDGGNYISISSGNLNTTESSDVFLNNASIYNSNFAVDRGSVVKAAMSYGGSSSFAVNSSKTSMNSSLATASVTSAFIGNGFDNTTISRIVYFPYATNPDVLSDVVNAL